MTEWKLSQLTVDGKGSYGIGAPAVPLNPSLYTYLRITDIADDGTLQRDGRASVEDPDAKNYLLKENDVVFARTGNSTGRAYFYEPSEGDLVYAGFLIKFSLDPKKVNPRILKYYTHSKPYYDWVHSFDTGATRGNINAKTLGEMPIILPERHIQDRIVSILSSLDAQIENNNRINRNLEEHATALFKSWFVDFKPFADDEFVSSEIGDIPSSLKLDKITNIPHVLETGRRPKGGVGEIKDGVPSVGAEHVKGLGAYDYSKTKYIPIDFAKSVKSGIVKGYELLIYKDGGKPGYFIPNFSIFGEGYPFSYCILNEHVFKLDFEGNRAYNAFAYFYFHTDYVMNYLNAEGGKAAIPGINQQAVNSLWIFTPDNPKVKEFGDIVLPMITKILHNLSENKRLADLRDTLLPKLMKGEIEL